LPGVDLHEAVGRRRYSRHGLSDRQSCHHVSGEGNKEEYRITNPLSRSAFAVDGIYVRAAEIGTLDDVHTYARTSHQAEMTASGDKPANAASDPGPASPSRAYQRMTPFEAGGILGVIGGAVVGAVLCRSHGTLAEVGGAVGGGVAGLFTGVLLVFPISIAWGLARILARIYWEVLTGRRKLPSMRSQTKAHRRRVLGLIAGIFAVSAMVWAGIYFMGSDEQRSRVPRAAGWAFGISLIGLLALVVQYRRHPPQQELLEFSTNFDSEMVRPFLERIQSFIESGFGPAQIEQICQVVATLPQDQERTLEFQIRHAGEDAKFEVRVVMDDIDAPDIYFFAPAALRQQIESEFRRFAAERGN